ncbi:hypothetical protein [Streptomyces sp. CB02460]|nr:hypothetical protein [Streptomyces sp. CB02460]
MRETLSPFIAFSIIAHSSTDVPIARLFDVEDLAGVEEPRRAETPTGS